MTSTTDSSANSSAEIINQRTIEAAEILGVEPSVVTECLNRLGIKDTDMGLKILNSDNATEEDAYQVFYISHKDFTKTAFPMPIFKTAWAILKGKNPFSTEKLKEVLPERVENWSDKQLVENYHSRCNPEVEERLKKISNNRPFIIFKSGEDIDVENSLKLLRLARRQSTPFTYDVGDELKSVYLVGEFPLEFVYESPFNPGSILADGYCEKTGITFLLNGKNNDLGMTLVSGEEDILSFLRLLHEMETLSSLEQRKSAKSSLSWLMHNYPRVAKRFKELKEDNKLPSMKMKLSKRPGGSDPFRQHKAW
jgi:hypothetical protein